MLEIYRANLASRRSSSERHTVAEGHLKLCSLSRRRVARRVEEVVAEPPTVTPLLEEDG